MKNDAVAYLHHAEGAALFEHFVINGGTLHGVFCQWLKLFAGWSLVAAKINNAWTRQASLFISFPHCAVFVLDEKRPRFFIFLFDVWKRLVTM
jgi:hypothetical protein